MLSKFGKLVSDLKFKQFPQGNRFPLDGRNHLGPVDSNVQAGAGGGGI